MITTGVETFSLKGRTIETIIAQQVELSAIASLEKPCIEKKGTSIMSKNTTQITRQFLSTPGRGHMTLLTSFRLNGQGVGTPVGTVASDGKLYFMTTASTWKVKRITNNPRVTLAPGTRKGEALGTAIEGTARRLYGEELKRARELLRVGIVGHFWSFIFDLRNPGDKQAVYEISLAAELANHEKESALL